MSWLGRWLGGWLGSWLGSIAQSSSTDSCVAAVYYLLATNTSLTAIVPSRKIKAGVLPIKTGLPCIGIQEISVMQRNNISNDSLMNTARIQVTVLANTYPLKKQIMGLIEDALPNTRGFINGILLESIKSSFTSPEFEDQDYPIYMQSRDYIVRFLGA